MSPSLKGFISPRWVIRCQCGARGRRPRFPRRLKAGWSFCRGSTISCRLVDKGALFRWKAYHDSPNASVSGQISFRVFPVFPGFPVLRNRFLGFFPPKFWKGFCGNHDRFLSFSVFAVSLRFRRFFVGKNQQKLIFANPDAPFPIASSRLASSFFFTFTRSVFPMGSYSRIGDNRSFLGSFIIFLCYPFEAHARAHEAV